LKVVFGVSIEATIPLSRSLARLKVGCFPFYLFPLLSLFVLFVLSPSKPIFAL
jgi:hypothetical protein